MTRFEEGFEGGAPSTSLASGSSIFDGVTATNSGGTITYSNTVAMYGTRSMYVVPNGPSGAVFATKAISPTKNAAIRFYYRRSEDMTQSPNIFGFYIGSTRVANIAWNTTSPRRLRFTAAASSGDHQFTAAAGISNNVWYRIELYVSVGTTTSNSSARIAYYLGDSETPVEDSGTISGINLGVDPITDLRFGISSTSPETVGHYVDGFGLDDNASGFMGNYIEQLPTPVVTLGTTTSPSTVGGSNGTQVVTWSSIPGAVSYDAYIALTDTPAQGDFVLRQSNVTSPYTFTGLSAGAQSFGIRARS